MPIVSAKSLKQIVAAILRKSKAPEEEAQIVAEHLVDAEACGVVSHGLLRVPQYVEALAAGRTVPDAKLRIVSHTPATLLLDGQQGFGQVMALRAMDMAVERAETIGACVVSLSNCSHTGRIGYYTEHAARRGMAAMMMVNSGGNGQWVAPFGGMLGRLSTNPISIAVPSDGDEPIVLDMATSVAPEGKVKAHQVAGRMLPPGWLIDHQGRPSTDPAALYGPPSGALLPFGFHKGSGLGLLVDALAGGLSGDNCCTDASAPKTSKTDGVFMVAIKVAAFRELVDFRENMGRLVQHVKSCPPSEGVAEVLVAGEKEATTRRRRLSEGIPVEPATWQALQSFECESSIL